MTEPQTLMQMAGLPQDPPRLADAAVVIIDAQGEYLDGHLPLDGVEPALDRLQDLLARARAAGAAIVHVAHRGAAGGLFDRDTAGGAILPQAAPVAGEPVIEKELPNAFAGTGLQAELERIGRKDLIVAGFMTHMCVSSTARAALDLGFRTTIAADAAATRALPDPLGGAALDGAALHRAALAELADRFAIVTTVAALPD